MPKTEKPRAAASVVTPSKKPKKKKKNGRPTKYKEEYNDLAFKFSLLGATDEQMCANFNVDLATFNRWKIAHPKFREAIKNGKEKADANVSNSLYHRALGYSTEETDVKIYKGQIIETKIIKHYPPDPISAIFWLKNRQAKNWREKQEVEHRGTIDVIEVTNYNKSDQNEAK